MRCSTEEKQNKLNYCCSIFCSRHLASECLTLSIREFFFIRNKQLNRRLKVISRKIKMKIN